MIFLKMNLNHKLYIYDTLGLILFRNKWETVWKIFDTSSKKENQNLCKFYISQNYII